MRNYRVLKETLHKADTDIRTNIGHLHTIAKDAVRVSKVAKDVNIIITDIERQFEQTTKLNKIDIAFLFFAVALQCARQYLLTDFKERHGDQEAVKNTPGHTDEHSDRLHKWYHPTFDEICTNPVPFDAIYGSKDFDLNMGGGFNHRASTLGHDPILGWIFGTMNIATSTMTNWKFQSFHIKTGEILTGAARDKITNHADTSKILTVSVDRLTKEGIEGKKIIGASVIKEAIHLRSDINTKASLPLPFISVISPDFARQLADFGFDMANVETVMKQAAMSALINTFVAMIHGLFYDKKECSSWNLYQVRTRKIISYSNVIASASNIIVVAIGAAIGVSTGNADMVKKSLNKLDIGGFLMTLYRIVSDYNFIKQIKQEFIEKEFFNTVMGQDFNF